MEETSNPTRVAKSKFPNDFFKSSKSYIPKAKPDATIGPIKGEISIAPIITAVEFTFNPTDATKIAQAKIQRLAPEKEIFPFTLSNVFCLSSSPL